MDRIIKHRALAILVAIVVLTLTSGVVFAACKALPWQTGGLSRPSSRATATPQAAHQPHTVSIQLATQEITPNSQLRVMASGFLSGEPLVVSVEDMHGQVYAHTTFQADDNGRLPETALVLPARLQAGDYRLLVVGNTSHRTVSTTFQLYTIPPTVTLDTYTATPGQLVGFSGNGFIPKEVVSVYLGQSLTPLLSRAATAQGTVSGSLEIPKLPAGTYTLTLRGKTSQTPTFVGFNVQGFSPWVVLDRYTVAPGEGLGFIARGFAPGERVSVYLNAHQGMTGKMAPVLSMTADSSGQVVVQDTWAPGGAVSGTNVLSLVGQWSKATTSAEFTVQASEQSAATPTIP